MIDKERLIDDSINLWGSYDPNIVRFAKFYKEDPSQIAAGRKVVDTYHAFSTGKASLYFSFEDNFGDLAKDEDATSKLFVKSLFVRDAILHFGLCLDLSWQAVWAYIHPSSVEDLLKDNFIKFEKDCDRDSLLTQLDCCLSQGSMKAQMLKSIVKDFDNDETTTKLRELYNYMKHRGDFIVEGLGDNPKNQAFSIQGETLPSLSRREYNIDELQILAFNYAISFMNYFQKVVDVIISEKYRDNNCALVDVINAQLEMKKIYDSIKK